MSTAIVDGGPCGPDEGGGQYRNRILTDRVAWWEAVGARQGVVRGAAITTVAGQMNVDVSAFLALLEERDASGNLGSGRGYAVWADTTTVAAFDVASASDRNDAIVVAFCDVSVGAAALGTETSVAGGQLVVVSGVSGVTTPRTDTQIQDAIGSGGWVRLADVLVESTDTEIAPSNIALAAARWAVEPIAIVRATSAQTIPDSTQTTIIYDEQVRVTGNIGVDLGAGEVTINVPGVYEVAGVVCVDDAGGRLVVELVVDGARLARQGDASPTNPSGSLSTSIDALGGEVVSMRCQQVSGSAQDTRELPYPRLSVRRAG